MHYFIIGVDLRMKNNTITAPADDSVLALFNLERDNIEEFSVSHQKDGLHLFVKLVSTPHICPVCRNSTEKVKAYYTKRITHSILNNNRCFIDYKARRYICTRCHKTFYEHNPFTMDGMKISLATVYNILEDLKNPRTTFASATKRYNVSPSTAASVFDRHVHISRRKLPEYLCIDEVYSIKSYNSKYVCVLVDYIDQKIVDILPSRKKYDLIAYFSSIPREERENVKIVSFDMWETYRVVSKIMFPNSVQAIDHFHLIQELNRQVDRIRLRVMNKYYKQLQHLKYKQELNEEEKIDLEEASKRYYALKKFNWMFFKNDNRIFDPNEEKKYNRVLEQYMNYYDIFEYMIHCDSDLDIAYDLKDTVINFYKRCNHGNAKKELEKIIIEMRSCKVREMNEFANTLSKWKYEIINSFITVSETKDKNNNIIHKKINNGIIENRNKSIKLLKHSSNGYLNWERFRNRVLYSLNDDTTFYMYPTSSKES